VNQKPSVRILIATGHTGGHYFPAVTFARGFKKTYPQAEVHLLLGRMPTFAKNLVSSGELYQHLIKIPSFSEFFSFKIIFFLLKYCFAYVQTLNYIWNLKPSLVVGFGSYASVPSLLCAVMLRRPTLLHEQNVMAGRANRLLSYCVDRLAISFPETQGISPKRKIVFTGYPLREEFLDVLQYQVKNSFKILVFGGSQGARQLNHLFLEALGRLQAEEKKGLAVKHIVGVEDLNQIRLLYEQSDVQAEVEAFSENIVEDYRSADLIISRSGAGTVFELIATGRPAVLVPYPHAYAHQRLNADFLSKRQAAILILEENLSADVLADTVLNLKHNPNQRTQLATHLKQLGQSNATQNLVQLAWELLCKKN